MAAYKEYVITNKELEKNPQSNSLQEYKGGGWAHHIASSIHLGL
jgi:hypothetical protein